QPIQCFLNFFIFVFNSKQKVNILKHILCISIWNIYFINLNVIIIFRKMSNQLIFKNKTSASSYALNWSMQRNPLTRGMLL
ncbi:hypothetical protein CVH06_17470, partial [Escherichia coli]